MADLPEGISSKDTDSIGKSRHITSPDSANGEPDSNVPWGALRAQGRISLLQFYASSKLIYLTFTIRSVIRTLALPADLLVPPYGPGCSTPTPLLSQERA